MRYTVGTYFSMVLIDKSYNLYREGDVKIFLRKKVVELFYMLNVEPLCTYLGTIKLRTISVM